MAHILFKKYFVYRKRKEIKAPEGFIYDKLLGAWIDEKNNSPLVLHKDFPLNGTKKQDVETGEDQKGQ